MKWTPEAEQRLKKAPFFIRPLIKLRAEAEARKQGREAVDSALLDALKRREHKG
ncbi:MAG: protochlorophyllide oxidoreductase [Deltaproteobacteria bacterium]|nr:MAG: protochlorophyllide oxidoreductase [Deltaproteobacteria bacterium]